MARCDPAPIRFACCARVGAQADDGAELSEDVANALASAMLARLRDRQPAVRCQAVLALARLADPGEVRAPRFCNTPGGSPEQLCWCSVTAVQAILSTCVIHLLAAP